MGKPSVHEHNPAVAMQAASRAGAAPLDVRVVKPVKRRVPVADLWRSRHVAWIIAVRDLKAKYKQSVLGAPWLVLQPLGLLASLVLVFRGVTSVNTEPVPYVLFALVGMAVWTFVLSTLTVGSMTFVANADLVRRVAPPRVAFITSSIISNMVAPALVLVAALVGLLFSSVAIPVQALLMPAFAAWLCVLMAGILFVIAPVTARYRDVASIIPFWAQAGLFLTPIGYPLSSATPTLKTILSLNPFTGLVELWRWSLFGTSVEAFPILSLVAWSLLFVFGGWWMFSRMEVTLVDRL